MHKYMYMYNVYAFSHHVIIHDIGILFIYCEREGG